ncbi:unnamed protein product [Brachionus calyciflorus]|uniref:CBM1 domain-containing protein n=1 Tax=Brachionus calyciflorus TaxID=104777 RepID=A0A814DXX2_9BILA|nr:unnamed protein product [Brachionus calyciflorus]
MLILSLFFLLTFSYRINSVVPIYEQCGGQDYKGDTVCDDSSECIFSDPYYSQCRPKANDRKKLNEWDQCGGKEYKGNRVCQSWLKCVFINDWYHQCQRAETSPSHSTTKSPTTIRRTTYFKPSSISHQLTALTTPNKSSDKCNSNFQKIRLKLGISHDLASNSDINYGKYDYISAWLAYDEKLGTDYNKYIHGPMIETAKKYKKSLVFYMYLIGFEARFKKNLQDCDVNLDFNLCTHGAQFIRDNRKALVWKYKYHANWIAEKFGKNEKVVFAIEPDFVQYFSDPRQVNGSLSGQYMRQLFDDFVNAIKAEMPNALISWDISPWLGVNNMKIWWSFFETAKIDYIHTSGGKLRPDLNQIRENEIKWKFMSNLTKKYIIANCGHGGDKSSCNAWANQYNLNNRINDGVIAITVLSGNANIPRPAFNCSHTF